MCRKVTGHLAHKTGFDGEKVDWTGLDDNKLSTRKCCRKLGQPEQGWSTTLLICQELVLWPVRRVGGFEPRIVLVLAVASVLRSACKKTES
jgi:hypothetical protein